METLGLCPNFILFLNCGHTRFSKFYFVMYEIPYPFGFNFLMLSSDVLQKLGFEKHVHPHSIEWILHGRSPVTNRRNEFCVIEIPPHFDDLNGVKSYIGTQFFIGGSASIICFLHDLLEHLRYFDPSVMIVLEENAKQKDMFVYFLNYFDYKFKHERKTRPTPRWN